jgi:hypothetical protein
VDDNIDVIWMDLTSRWMITSCYHLAGWYG